MASSSRAAIRMAADTCRHSTSLRPRLVHRLPKTSSRLTRASTRSYASGPGTSSRLTPIFAVVGLVGAGGAGYYYLNRAPAKQESKDSKSTATAIKEDAKADAKAIGDKARAAVADFIPQQKDYQEAYNMIAKLLEEKDEYDDGSYGPVLLRLAWHASGTYDAATGTGGSNGATMRFAPEGDHGANAGLKHARDFLEPVKEKFPWISYSDLWILAGVCSIQEMHGPDVPFRPGRQDRDLSFCTPDGRLPDGSKGADYLRNLFARMGFNDQELVALSGAHALGRCHTDRSGWTGPWTHSPTVVTNYYYKLLFDEKWSYKKWDGPKQFEDQGTKTLMMLPTDMALVQDEKLRKYAKKYADSEETFFKDFSAVLVKLFELGVPFTTSDRFTLKRMVQ